MAAFAIVQPDKSEWYRCRPWIEAALEYTGGTHTIQDIEAGIEAGQFQFYSSANSAAVTEIIKYPQITILNYFLIGGDLGELIREIEPHVTHWAKVLYGVKRATGVGRKGFERAFRNSGYRPLWSAIGKDLT